METRPKPKARARRFDSPEQETYLALWRAYDRLKALEDAFFAEWDLTAQQYNVLRLLRAEHPAAVPTLALVGKLVSRAPDVTRMLDKLEGRDLIERQRTDADRRSVLVSITASGLVLLEAMAQPLKDYHESQLGHMAPQDLKTLTVLLRAAAKPHEPPDSSWL
jgi:DNA-binding MarR family transcriptional regulator